MPIELRTSSCFRQDKELRGLVCYYRAKLKNGGQVQKMDFLHIYVIVGSLTKHNRCEVFF